MKLREIVSGKSVTEREIEGSFFLIQEQERAMALQYRMPLIVFSLNISGKVRVFPLSVRTFEEGCTLIRTYCKVTGIPLSADTSIRRETGYAEVFAADADPVRIKKAMVTLEDENTLGGLFYIEVLREDCTPVTREDLGLAERACILCGRPAGECQREHRHTENDMLIRMAEIMTDYFSERYAKEVAQTACRALLYEVHATPKPGLVDRNNNGAHNDMDVFTFETSALSILSYFKAFVSYGILHSEEDLSTILDGVRPIGLEAEIEMRRATGNVNTHKGAIFSMGILCTALGILYGRGIPYDRDILSRVCASISSGLMDEFSSDANDGGRTGSAGITAGRRSWKKAGIGGIRQEAAAGYPTVFRTALPRLCGLLEQGLSLNDAGILTLIDIMAETDDTNIINRSSVGKMRSIQSEMHDLAASCPEKRNYRQILTNLDDRFIRQHISPGGSADLLAMTYFLYFVESSKTPSRI